MVQAYLANQYKVNLIDHLGRRTLGTIPIPGVVWRAIPIYWPGHQSTRTPTLLRIWFTQGCRSSRCGVANRYNLFNPKIGIAWQPKAMPNTSIRAAFGICSSPIAYNDWNPISDTAPFAPIYTFSAGGIINGQPVPIIPFSDPYSVYQPTGGQSPFPPFPAPAMSRAPMSRFRRLRPTSITLLTAASPPVRIDLEPESRTSIRDELAGAGRLRGLRDLSPR